MTIELTEEQKHQVSLANVLVAALAGKLRQTLQPDGATPGSVLEWLATQPPETVRLAIIATQPRGWDTGVTMLVDSITPDQRVGMLAALIAVWVQAQ